jgi:hypothetical protein
MLELLCSSGRGETKMPTLEELIEEAKRLPPMTPRQRQEQSLNFTYGNLASSTNHKPSLVAFQRAAVIGFGWTEIEFAAWSRGKEWRP